MSEQEQVQGQAQEEPRGEEVVKAEEDAAEGDGEATSADGEGDEG
jgi:hypothetical protein